MTLPRLVTRDGVAEEKGKVTQIVQQGAYENGIFKFLRIWNGDETDWGLNFGAEPLVLSVSLATY